MLQSNETSEGIAQAFSGAMTAMGGGPSHRPQLIEWTFSDEVGAMNFYASILNAIVARYRTGKGQRLSRRPPITNPTFFRDRQQGSGSRQLDPGTFRHFQDSLPAAARTLLAAARKLPAAALKVPESSHVQKPSVLRHSDPFSTFQNLSGTFGASSRQSAKGVLPAARVQLPAAEVWLPAA